MIAISTRSARGIDIPRRCITNYATRPYIQSYYKIKNSCKRPDLRVISYIASGTLLTRQSAESRLGCQLIHQAYNATNKLVNATLPHFRCAGLCSRFLLVCSFPRLYVLSLSLSHLFNIYLTQTTSPVNSPTLPSINSVTPLTPPTAIHTRNAFALPARMKKDKKTRIILVCCIAKE